MPELSLGLLALVTIVANLQRYELLQSVPVKWKAGKCRSGAFDISKAVSYASAIMLLIFLSILSLLTTATTSLIVMRSLAIIT